MWTNLVLDWEDEVVCCKRVALTDLRILGCVECCIVSFCSLFSTSLSLPLSISFPFFELFVVVISFSFCLLEVLELSPFEHSLEDTARFRSNGGASTFDARDRRSFDFCWCWQTMLSQFWETNEQMKSKHSILERTVSVWDLIFEKGSLLWREDGLLNGSGSERGEVVPEGIRWEKLSLFVCILVFLVVTLISDEKSINEAFSFGVSLLELFCWRFSWQELVSLGGEGRSFVRFFWVEEFPLLELRKVLSFGDVRLSMVPTSDWLLVFWLSFWKVSDSSMTRRMWLERERVSAHTIKGEGTFGWHVSKQIFHKRCISVQQSTQQLH